MITIFAENFNDISQESYDSLVFQKLQIHQLSCPCCQHSGSLIMHGSYQRSVKRANSLLSLTIQRVLCKECLSTHALLPASIVPYSQIQLLDQISIIKLHEQKASFSDFLETHPLLDENNIKSIIRSYVKHWLERLLSIPLSIFPISQLLLETFSHYHRQFMQIKNTKNSLFLTPT